jgi:hypothetical protein
MRADLVALGARLKWVAPDEKEEPALKTVIERLVHEGEGILLIYDNAVDADASSPICSRWLCPKRSVGCRSRTNRPRPIASGSNCRLPNTQNGSPQFPPKCPMMLATPRPSTTTASRWRSVRARHRASREAPPAAEPLIVHAALLAPEPIPLFLFSQGREKFGEQLAGARRRRP